jgi:phosphoenolpyruvate-protein kinase (PTS system EI component)
LHGKESSRIIQGRLRLGAFVETPAMVLNVGRLLEQGLDHVFVGTKDLTQLTLGYDRTDPSCASAFDIADESVLRLVQQAIEACQRHEPPVPVFVFTDVNNVAKITDRLGWDVSLSMYAAQYARIAAQCRIRPGLSKQS